MTDSEYDPINEQEYMNLSEDEDDVNNDGILPDESASNVNSRLSSKASSCSTTRPKSGSSVWQFFDRNSEQHPGRPVCSTCKTVFEVKTSTSTLRRHLDLHKIVAPKRKQKSIDDYRIDPHTPKDQKERDDGVITWIICDQQPFTVVECPQWRQMISKKKMEPALNLLAADNESIKQKYPTDDDRLNINNTMLLLEPIEHGTCFLSGSSYPTHGDFRFVFLGIQEHLTRYINDDNFSQKEMADSIYQKLDEYWPIMDSNSCISAVLDPRTKLSVFLTDTEKNKVKDTINNLAKYYSTTTSTASSTTGSELLVDTRKYFRKLCNINTDPNNSALQSNSSNNLAGDLEKYLLHDLEDNIEPLLCGKHKQRNTLF
ncbi:unnamed protein product [Rhizophagus irregularis]|nr:unnamed protein product [Rhizophagus irregularis]